MLCSRIDFFSYFLLTEGVFNTYRSNSLKESAAYTARSTVRRIKSQLDQYVVISDFMENALHEGYILDKDYFQMKMVLLKLLNLHLMVLSPIFIL